MTNNYILTLKCLVQHRVYFPYNTGLSAILINGYVRNSRKHEARWYFRLSHITAVSRMVA
jgi:hypothetical protein